MNAEDKEQKSHKHSFLYKKSVSENIEIFENEDKDCWSEIRSRNASESCIGSPRKADEGVARMKCYLDKQFTFKSYKKEFVYIF